MADYPKMLEYLENAIQASAWHSDDAVRRYQEECQRGRDRTEAAIPLAKLDQATRDQFNDILAKLRRCGIARIEARAARLADLLREEAVPPAPGVVPVGRAKRWWEIWKQDPQKVAQARAVRIETSVRELMASIERLGSAVLSEQAYKAEVQKVIEPLAKRDVALLREALARADAAYDEQLRSERGDLWSMRAAQNTVRELRRQWRSPGT